MYLRRVEAYGFKSFADRQVFEFGPGITTVVGPNGSGKSNVSDAIRWALGEQSARAIRARKTEDFIFSGSDGRREMGMAEVILTLDNSEQWMPIDFDEVSVSRRAYRNGENEYRINGQKVRLLDVQDLFRRAQVGQNSYAMMSQGLVDEVLGLRPLERRNLIEEAADVHRHRIELTKAERRLTQTRDNLGHVRVTIRELAPRLRQLQRQSERVERYKGLDAELGAALEAYYESELQLAQEALTAAQSKHDQRSEAFATAQRRAQAFEPEINAAERAVAEARAELGRAQSRERELVEQSLALGQQLALAEQRHELLLVRRGEVEASLAELTESPDIEVPEPEQMVLLDSRVDEIKADLDMAREGVRNTDEAVRTVLRTLAEAEARRMRLETELADIESRNEQLAEQLRRQELQRTVALEQREGLLSRLRSYGQEALRAHRERVTLAEYARETQRENKIAERKLEEAMAFASSAREDLRDATAERGQLSARLELISMLSAKVADPGSASQELLRAANEPNDGEEPLSGVVGLISRLIRVPRGLEAAIEAALAEQLSAVVVERQEDALAAIDHLRNSGAGAVTVLPREGIPHQYPLNMMNERGVVGVAARLVKVDREYRPLIDTLLGRTIVVEDVPTALKTVSRGLGSVVTKDGVLLRANGAFYGGARGTAAEQFAMQDEVEFLPQAIEVAIQAEDSAAARVQRLDDVMADARQGLTDIRHAVDLADKACLRHEQAIETRRRKLVAVAGELRLAHAAIAIDGMEVIVDSSGDAIEQRNTELAMLATEIERLRDRSEAVVTERDTASEKVEREAALLAAAEGERAVISERRASAEEESRRDRERLAQRREQTVAIQRDLEDTVLALRDFREQIANIESARSSAEEAVAPAHATLAEAERAERELAATRGDEQAQLFAAERELLETQSALRELASRVKSLEQQLVDDGLVLHEDGSVRRPRSEFSSTDDGTLQALSSDNAEDEVGDLASASPPARGGADVDPVQLRDRISELRGEIRALGPVNLEALEDLSEEQERHDFLSDQLNDLEAAESQLRDAITDLEQGIRERFDESFEQVNANFREYFERFFGGGRAELVVVEPEVEGGDAGVDVRAQPPGKRVSSLALLSGGERALTSVALLFALLAVNPAPVCVLDEVDAALDEANVDRFVDTLRELCERSQFIVITHNRGTIEVADTIYGVSMGDDSVSRVLSLRLADLPQAS